MRLTAFVPCSTGNTSQQSLSTVYRPKDLLAFFVARSNPERQEQASTKLQR
jgi:hypothetical protein